MQRLIRQPDYKVLEWLDKFVKGTAEVGSIKMVDMGGVRTDPVTGKTSITFGGVERITTPDPRGGLIFVGFQVQINSNPAVNGPQGYNNRFGVGNDVNRAITLIHEFAHAVDLLVNDGTSLIKDDTGNEELSRQNSQKVFDACFKKQ